MPTLEERFEVLEMMTSELGIKQGKLPTYDEQHAVVKKIFDAIEELQNSVARLENMANQLYAMLKE